MKPLDLLLAAMLFAPAPAHASAEGIVSTSSIYSSCQTVSGWRCCDYEDIRDGTKKRRCSR